MRMLKLRTKDPPARAGRVRARVNSYLQTEPYLRAKVTRSPNPRPRKKLAPETKRSFAESNRTRESVTLGKNISPR